MTVEPVHLPPTPDQEPTLADLLGRNPEADAQLVRDMEAIRAAERAAARASFTTFIGAS